MSITRQDRISIIVTFACGMVAGGYLYLTGFLPTFHLPEATTQDTYTKLVIVADTYGGCADTGNCLSFQVLYDRSYQAVIGATVEGTAFTGAISRSLMNTLVRTVNTDSLQANAEVLSEPSCRNTAAGSSNVRFQITYDGKNYTLDTCTSAIDYDSELWQSLRALYNEVAAGAT